MRYNPVLNVDGKNPFQLDSKAPSIPLKDYIYQEARYTILARTNPEVAAQLLREAQEDVHRRWCVYESRASMPGSGTGDGKRLEDGKMVPLDVKVGDRILFGKYSGSDIKLDGDEYMIMREDEVLGVLDAAPKVAKQAS